MTATPHILMRAVVQQPALRSTRRGSITATDKLFAQGGPLGPDAKFPAFTYGDLGRAAPQMTADTKATVIAPLFGEKSDLGARDPLTNAPKSKGVLPGTFLGRFTVDLGAVTVNDGLPTSGNDGLGGTDGFAVLGSGGTWISDGTVTNDPYHGVAPVFAGVMGELLLGRASTPSPAGTTYGFRPVWNSSLAPDYWIVWQVPADIGDTWDPFTNPAPAGSNIRFKIIPAAPSNPYSDWQFITWFTDVNDGTLWEGSKTGTISGASEWGILAFGYGPWFEWLALDGSDLGGGDPNAKHDRVQLDITALSGTQLLVPGVSPCPWTTFTLTNPDTGRTFDLAAIGVKGPLLDDHLAGVVNIAACGVGLMDGSNLPFVKVSDVIQIAVDTFMVQKKTAGPWASSAQFADGTYVVNSSGLAACQAVDADALASDGLLAGWYPNTQRAVPDVIADLQTWTGWKSGIGRQGQNKWFNLDTSVDTSAWPRIQHETDIFGGIDITYGEERENVANGVCDYDADAAKFRVAQISEKNVAGIARYQNGDFDGEKVGATMENALLVDEAQLRYVLQRRVARLGLGSKQIVCRGPLQWLDWDIGDGVRLTSEDGPGANGYVDQPCVILRRQFDLASRSVTLTLWDVSEFLITSRFANALSRRSVITNGTAPLVTNDDDLAPLVLR